MSASDGPAHSMPLCQIGISATDLPRTHQWYRRALGLLPGGRLRRIDEEGAGAIPDLPEAAFDVWCLIDRQEWFQIEMFEFQRPRMRTIPEDWRPCDVGYSTVGIHVVDFDEALARLRRTSGRLLTEPVGPLGSRRVCLRDPEGILLELMEDDVRLSPAVAARPSVPASFRFITLSVPDLERARRFWIEALGLSPATGVSLHGAEHERLWGLEGAERHTLLLWAGDFLVELVQYTQPIGRARPAGQLLSDQGVLNVAFGSRDKQAFDDLYRRIRKHGYRFNTAPWTVPDVATVVYTNDGLGSSVELMHVEPAALERMGFLPPRP